MQITQVTSSFRALLYRGDIVHTTECLSFSLRKTSVTGVKTVDNGTQLGDIMKTQESVEMRLDSIDTMNRHTMQGSTSSPLQSFSSIKLPKEATREVRT